MRRHLCGFSKFQSVRTVQGFRAHSAAYYRYRLSRRACRGKACWKRIKPALATCSTTFIVSTLAWLGQGLRLGSGCLSPSAQHPSRHSPSAKPPGPCWENAPWPTDCVTALQSQARGCRHRFLLKRVQGMDVSQLAAFAMGMGGGMQPFAAASSGPHLQASSGPDGAAPAHSSQPLAMEPARQASFYGTAHLPRRPLATVSSLRVDLIPQPQDGSIEPGTTHPLSKAIP